MPNYLELIKKAAIDAVKAENPVVILYGNVTSIEPLRISIEQKLTLTSAQLILTKNVIDYDIEMTVDHTTEPTFGGSGEASFASHSHEYSGKKTFRIHNGLKVNDEVILLQIQGGQKFIVFDKVVKP